MGLNTQRGGRGRANYATHRPERSCNLARVTCTAVSAKRLQNKCFLAPACRHALHAGAW